MMQEPNNARTPCILSSNPKSMKTQISAQYEKKKKASRSMIGTGNFRKHVSRPYYLSIGWMPDEFWTYPCIC